MSFNKIIYNEIILDKVNTLKMISNRMKQNKRRFPS